MRKLKAVLLAAALALTLAQPAHAAQAPQKQQPQRTLLERFIDCVFGRTL